VHGYHTYMQSSLRLALRVDALSGNQYNEAHATNGLSPLPDHPGPPRRPSLLRRDKPWGIEPMMTWIMVVNGKHGPIIVVTLKASAGTSVICRVIEYIRLVPYGES